MRYAFTAANRGRIIECMDRFDAEGWVCQDVARSRWFTVFNCGRLTMEPISDADIVPVKVAHASDEASQAWSAGCAWYFVVGASGIILARPGDDNGMLCTKRSWRFIEAFIDAP